MFTLNWAGADPDQHTGTPEGLIATVDLYVAVDGGQPTLIGQFAAGTSDVNGVYSGSTTYDALTDGEPHTYAFYSIGIDDEQLSQAAPATPDWAYSTYGSATDLAVSPDDGISSIDGVTDTGAVTFTGDIATTGMTVEVLDTTTGQDLGAATVTGTSFSLPLNLAEGTHVLDARSTLNGVSIDALFTVLVDLTPPTSTVINLPADESSDTFPVSVSFSDPAGSGGVPSSGVSSVDLYDSVNGGPFTLYQTQMLSTFAASGTVSFNFTGQDRSTYAFYSVARDAAGNTESPIGTPIEASTYVADTNPPVTHVLASNPSYSWGQFPSFEFSGPAPSSYSNGVFTLDWAGADPDQYTGVPTGSIATVDIYVEVDGGAPVLIGSPNGGTPDANGVYSGSITYNALKDGLSHTYSFFSVGLDPQIEQYQGQLAGPAANPDVTFSGITFSSTATATAVMPGVETVSFGQADTFTATVTGADGSTPQDGSVQFLVNGSNLDGFGNPLQPVTLSNGTASIDINEPVGIYTVTAQYLGDTNYTATLPAAETSATLNVIPSATYTVVTPDSADVSSGQSVNFTATITDDNGVSPQGTGTVEFLVDGVPYGSEPVTDTSGLAQIAISEPAGTYWITAQFTSDNANYATTLPTYESGATLTVGDVLPATNLAISPDDGSSSSDGVTDTGTVTFTGDLSATGMTVNVFDAFSGQDFGPATVNGSTFSLPLSLAEGTYMLGVESTLAGTTSFAFLPVQVDLTPPTSTVINDLPSDENSDTFPVSVAFNDPAGSDGAVASGVSSVDLYDSVNGGPFTLYATQGVQPSASGTVTFNFTGQDRTYYDFYSVAQDLAGNVENVLGGSAIEASTYVLNLNPPVTHVLASNPSYSWGQFPSSEFSGLTPSSYSNGVFTLDWAGAEPDQNIGTPHGSIAFVDIYVEVDGGAPQLIGAPEGGTPDANGVYSGSITYDALSDGLPHTYSFYSVGIDDQYLEQPTPATPDWSYSTYVPASNLAISPNSGISAGITDTGAITFTGSLQTTGMTVEVLDATTGQDLGAATVTGTTFSLPLNLAEGTHVLDAQSTFNGVTLDVFYTVTVDLTKPTSYVDNDLGLSQTSDTFPVSVTFDDPAAPNGDSGAGVASVDLYVSVNNGPFTLYQTQTLDSPVASGSVDFAFTGQDRNIYAFYSIVHDAAGNTETNNGSTIEASTSIPDLNPPVTHVLASSPSYAWAPFPSSEFSTLTPSSYSNGVFTLNWAGADPDQNSGTPAGSIAQVAIYVEVDGGSPSLVGLLIPARRTATASTPDRSPTTPRPMDCRTPTASSASVSMTSRTRSTVRRDLPHRPTRPSATSPTRPRWRSRISRSRAASRNAPSSNTLDVNFNQSVSFPGSAMQDLATGLAGSSPSSFVELMWYGENLTASSTPAGSVNLFNTGTTALVTLSGNDLNINFGANGITSLLTETGVSGTGSPTSKFGDGWYALGIDPTGNPSAGQTFWLPFYRLLGSATGDLTVSGTYATPGSDAYAVYHGEGQEGSLVNADVNGDGVVNSKDLTETVAAKGDSVGTTPPQSFPQFQLLSGAAGPGTAVAVTQTQVQALLPQAVAAWQGAGLDAADVQRLESVQVQVGNLSTGILGLEAAGAITINQTAAGNSWYVGAGSGTSQAFGLVGPGGEAVAGPGSPAAGEVDLLTVLEHELGHVIGLSDNSQDGDLMDITLGLGIRRAPTATDVAAIAQASNAAVVAPTPEATTRVLTSNVQPRQSALLNGSVSQAAVDAALASMTSSAVGTGDTLDPAVNESSSTQSMGRISVIGGMKNGKHPIRKAAHAYPGRLLSTLFPRGNHRPGQISAVGLKSLAKEQGK